MRQHDPCYWVRRLTALVTGAMLLQTGGCAISDDTLTETLNYAVELVFSSILTT